MDPQAPPTLSLNRLRVDDLSRREQTSLRNVLGAGCVALGVVWAVEASQGQVAPWDAWSYPLLMLTCGLCMVVLQWWPRYVLWARIAGVCAPNVYLALTLYLALKIGRAHV